MSKQHLIPSLVLGLIVVASVGPKIWLSGRSPHSDVTRLNRDVQRRLAGAGFRTVIEPLPPVPAIRASLGPCQLLIRNGDAARELGSLFAMQSDPMGPVRIIYRDQWSAGLPSQRPSLELSLQRSAAKIGLLYGRPAVLAVAENQKCPALNGTLQGIEVYQVG